MWERGEIRGDVWGPNTTQPREGPITSTEPHPSARRHTDPNPKNGLCGTELTHRMYPPSSGITKSYRISDASLFNLQTKGYTNYKYLSLCVYLSTYLKNILFLR